MKRKLSVCLLISILFALMACNANNGADENYILKKSDLSGIWISDITQNEEYSGVFFDTENEIAYISENSSKVTLYNELKSRAWAHSYFYSIEGNTVNVNRGAIFTLTSPTTAHLKGKDNTGSATFTKYTEVPY